jgi:hypothetical protein
MRVHKGRAIAGGILCVAAATVAVWSGPLASATAALHSGTSPSSQTSAVSHARR